MVFNNAYGTPYGLNDHDAPEAWRGPAAQPPAPARGEAAPPSRGYPLASYEWTIVEQKGYFDLDASTVDKYRNLFRLASPDHAWLDLDKHDFLERVGALESLGDGKYALTAAGLLMFGRERDIVRVFPSYFLDCRVEGERSGDDTIARARWKSRFTSQDGDWSGNLLDFYHRAYGCLVQTLPSVVAQREDGERQEALHAARSAVREALVNALVNADYAASGSVLAIRSPRAIEIANPGHLGVELDLALTGGVTNPYNKVVARMFAHAGLCDRAGYGLPCIFEGWHKLGMPSPKVEELSRIDRVRVTLPFDRRVEAYEAAGDLPAEEEPIDELLAGEAGDEPGDAELAGQAEVPLEELLDDEAADEVDEADDDEANDEEAAAEDDSRKGKRARKAKKDKPKKKRLRRKGDDEKAERKEKRSRGGKRDKDGKRKKLRLRDLEKAKGRKKKRRKEKKTGPMPDDVVAEVRSRLSEHAEPAPAPQKQTTSGHGAFMHDGKILVWGDSGDPMN